MGAEVERRAGVHILARLQNDRPPARTEMAMIPELVDGVLPDGVHECTFEEVSDAFGRFWRTDQRFRLTEQLREFLDAARKSGIVAAIVVDGSFVTAKEVPNDIDVIVAYRPDLDLGQELRPFEYNVLSKRAVRRAYRFDALVAADGSEQYEGYVDFFSRVRKNDPDQQTSKVRKGILRISL